MPHQTARRAVRAEELLGFGVPRELVRRPTGGASRRRTVCEWRFKGELRTSAHLPATFVGGGVGERCGMRHGVASVLGLTGTLVPIRNSADAISFPFWRPRNSRRRDRAVRPRILPQGHTSQQPTDFMAIVACLRFPIREPGSGMQCFRVMLSAPPMRGRAQRGSSRRKGQG
jgi:hypothetical protein